MKLRVLDRYLVREVAQAWLAVTLVLVAVLMTSRLTGYLSEAASGEIAGDLVLTLLGLEALANLGLVLPASLFLAIVLALGRLYRDSEMAALMACGAGPRSLYRSLFMLALPLAVLVGFQSLWVSPWANRASAAVELQAQQSIGLEGARPGRFLTFSGAEGTFYIEGIEGKRLRKVFAQAETGSQLTLIAAEAARLEVEPDGDRYLVLLDGTRYEGRPGTAGWKVIRFAEHGLRLPDRKITPGALHRRALPTPALIAMATPTTWVELQWRLSLPMMALVLTFLALPLSRSQPRASRYGKLIAAVLVYVGYSNLLNTAQQWVKDGQMPVAVGLWWVHGLILVLGVVMLLRQFGWRRTEV